MLSPFNLRNARRLGPAPEGWTRIEQSDGQRIELNEGQGHGLDGHLCWGRKSLGQPTTLFLKWVSTEKDLVRSV